MDPATISLILFGIQAAIKAEPAIADMLSHLFSGGIPSEADWAAARAIVATPFEALAPNSASQIATALAAAPPPPLAVVPPAGATPPPAPPLAPAPVVATIAASAAVAVQSLSAAPVAVQALSTPEA